ARRHYLNAFPAGAEMGVARIDSLTITPTGADRATATGHFEVTSKRGEKSEATVAYAMRRFPKSGWKVTQATAVQPPAPAPAVASQLDAEKPQGEGAKHESAQSITL